jgi:hypothetical protein
MCLSLTIFIYQQFTISLKIIFIIIIFKAFLYSKINADEDLLQSRAIGGESLDTSNFVLYIDGNGSRFIEVPYKYMSQWLKDQKMWRTVRGKDIYISLIFGFFHLVVDYVNNSMFHLFLFIIFVHQQVHFLFVREISMKLYQMVK